MGSFSRFMITIPGTNDESERSTLRDVEDEVSSNRTEEISQALTDASSSKSPETAGATGEDNSHDESSSKSTTAEIQTPDDIQSTASASVESDKGNKVSIAEEVHDPAVQNAADGCSLSSSMSTTDSEPALTKSEAAMPDSANSGEGELFLWPVQDFERAVKEVLARFSIMNAIWTNSRDGSFIQVTFVVPSGRKEENVLDALLESGIGKADNTSVSISPLTVCMGLEVKKDMPKVTSAGTISSKESAAKDTRESLNNNRMNLVPEVGDDETALLEDSAGQTRVEESEVAVEDGGDVLIDDVEESSFLTSIRSRIIVQPVIASLKANAEFTFDYLMMVILASLISAVGLIENNSVVLVASMLISPLMGPILAGVFGQAISDGQLRNVGIQSELIGLAICVVSGFLIGLPINFIMADQFGWTPASYSWPTLEMYGRGVPRNLVAGAVIALASGAAVALSVLGANQGSLVGVAISASLLPPAVNTGLLWAFSFKSAVKSPALKYPDQSANFTSLTANDTLISVPGSISCPELLDNTYKPVFTCNLALDGFFLGSVSFCLTAVNIAFICVAALLLLKLKQVHPRASVKNESEFWTQHVRVAKNYNTTVRPGTNMAKYLINETKTKLKLSESGAALKLLETADYIDSRNEAKGYSTYQTLSIELGDRLLSYGRQFQRSQSYASTTTDMQAVRQFHRQLSHDPRLQTGNFNLKKKMGRFEVQTNPS